MALAVWFPGTQDIKDYGLYGTEWINDNVTLVDDGKLGKCLSFNGTNARLSTTGFQLSNTWSYSVWIKDDSTLTSWRSVLILNTDGNDADCQLQFWIIANDTSYERARFEVGGNGKWASGMAYTPGEWNHFAATYDGEKILVYLNGTLSYTLVNTNAKLERYNLTIGARSTNTNGGHVGAGNYYKGLMNDLRIWDNEVISPKQIKILSQGLFLHYPLSREGFGCDNLLYGNYSCITTSSTNTPVGSAYLPDYNNVIINNQGKTLWFSFDYSCEGERNNNTGRHSSLGNRYGVHLSFRYTKTDGTQAQHYPCADYLTMSGTGRAVMSYTIPTDISFVDAFGISPQPYAGPADGNNATWYLRNLKLEIGDKATPWIPHQEDTLYYDMGLNTGNENLLTKSAINPANWTHIYPTCTRYTGDGYDNLFEMVTTSNFESVYLPVTVTANQQYTFSVTYQVLDSFELWQSSRPFSFQVLKAVPNGDTYSNVIGSILVGNTKMDTPLRGSTTFTPTGTTIWLNIPGGYFKDGSTSYNKRVKFSHLKLEKGTVATQWVSATSDLGYSEYYIHDVSGFGYNGITVGAPTYSSDTPRYNVSTMLQHNNDRVKLTNTPFKVIGYTTDEMSVSIWFKTNQSNGDGSNLFSLSENQFLRCRIIPAGNGIWSYVRYNSSSSAVFSESVGKTLIDDTWHHFVFVWNKGMIYHYVDGVLTNTGDKTSLSTSIYYASPAAPWRLGGYSDTAEPFIGQLSDFRVYATALSAEDAIALYNTPMTLANNGTLLTQGEFSEV